MDIRKWLGYNTLETELTNVDLKINDIMCIYKLIFEKLLSRDIIQFSSESFSEEKVSKNPPKCLESWLAKVGKATLVDLASYSYTESAKLVEELKYIHFILKSELENVEEFPEDVVASVSDTATALKDLLLTSSINLKLTK